MEPFYKSHWRHIDETRMTAYRSGFTWSAASEEIYEPAGIGAGQAIADFGCGPGHVAVELARRTGPKGHVHALDINAEFLAQVQENARAAGLDGRITTHLNDGTELPLAAGSLDLITARNTLMYVDDPLHTLTAFRRVLRPGGLAHSADGDWFMMVMEPVEHDLWRSFVKAAQHACRHADMGRRLYGLFTAAGFADVEVRVVAQPDTDGRLAGMVRNMAGYARLSGAIADDLIDSVVGQVESALSDGSYFAVSPQVVVTGKNPPG